MKARVLLAVIVSLQTLANAVHAERPGGERDERDERAPGRLFWRLTGNSGTNPAVDFLGTTDNEPLVLRTNGAEAVRITKGGEVGIGTSTPCAGLGGGCKLEVTGATTQFATGLANIFNSGLRGVGIRAAGQAAGVLGASPNAGGPGVAGGSGLATSEQPGVGVQGAGSIDGLQGQVAASGQSAVLAQSLGDGAGVAALFLGQALVKLGAGTMLVNRARIDNSGKGFFNGGTQTGGADFAESVDVARTAAGYGPGDVLVIDSNRHRTMRTTAKPYSTAIAGIYSLKPGVLATPHAMDDPRLASEIPLAIVGIVPCKVSAENGAIAPGDLLVTSATRGHAMKGTNRSRMLGAIVGKALEPLARGRGVIQVLVTLQ
jgi:hypothetical protein